LRQPIHDRFPILIPVPAVGVPTHAGLSNTVIAEALPARRKRAIRGASPAAIPIALKMISFVVNPPGCRRDE
jgi:hypothetical protein